MSSEPEKNTSTDRIIASLTSLADAADILAKAATSLAEAAQATIEALSTEIPRPEQPESPEEVHGINPGRGSDVASEVALSDRGEAHPREDADTKDGDGQEVGFIPAEEIRDPEEMSSRPLETSITAPTLANSSQINPHYRLLVDREADVLLFVCALIDKSHKVVCYMPCGTPPLKVYKQLLENVTGTSVHILNSSASLKRDQAYIDFSESSGAVLLVPESLLPQFRIEGENTWVIHVGWPANKSRYSEQKAIHRAQNNILVAYSGDQSLYPSGGNITSVTEPWPKGGASFRASVAILRPLYEVVLSEISLEMKSQVYTDWIQFHGIHGPRHIATWTPSIVVQRANEYLLKVLQWSGEHTGGEDVPLPEVTAGFVTQNSLQQAVQEGLIKLEEEGIAVPEPSPSPAPRSESVLTNIDFQHTTGLTYFALSEEFDAIPLMCFIAGKYHKVICFVEGQGVLRPYHDLFGRIAGRTIFFPKVLNDNQAVEEAVVRFLAAPLPTILLLACNTTNLPARLRQSSIDCCMYWGFNVPLKQARKNRSLINCDTTIIVMTRTQRDGIPRSNDIRKHPSASITLDLTENSLMAPIRSKTRLILESPKNKQIIQGLYTSRVYSIGNIPRNLLGAEGLARRVNQYAAQVLLHGSPEDGSEAFPPVAGRPTIPRAAIDKFDLQPAVDAVATLTTFDGDCTSGMSPEAEGDLLNDPSSVSLVSLAKAADLLSKAAATLAVAAQATAEALWELQGEGNRGENDDASIGRGSHLDRNADPSYQDGPNQGPDPDIDTREADGRENNIQVADPEEANGRHMDTDRPKLNREQRSTNSDQIQTPYRLLVDNEADVLLFVCALIDKRQRVICYMPCGNIPLKAYKELIENVTESPVHILNSSASLKEDQGYISFVKSNGSVLLVPETLLPQLEFDEENSWVIHVGWPVSETHYTSQRRVHHAQNNILVAYSGDQSLYPSSATIINLTSAWPKDGASFRAAVSILRPLYESMLSEISLETKAQVYFDWIQFHGPHGPRRVESWTPSMVVQRANDYLMMVLQWSGEHTGGVDIPFPEVSPGFVAQNELQSAVQEGVLRVEDEDEDTLVRPESPAPRPDSALAQTEFWHTTGQTYFSLDEEFDAIPLICFISEKYDKVICFLEGPGALRCYRNLIMKITGRQTIFPTAMNDKQVIEEAVLQFLSAPAPAILLLTYNTSYLPPTLGQGSIDCCIYWSFNPPLRQAKKNQPLINCETTIIIMPTIQQRGITFGRDVMKHPSASIPLDLTEDSVLAPMRNKTKAALISSKRIVKSLYMSRVYGLGVVRRASLSAEDVARRANQYAARVLLHGDIQDGSETFPPVAGRPTIPKTTVEKFDLQPAVDAGLLTV